MTSQLQINRYDRLVRRLMNIVGEGAIVTGVLPDVFPVMEMENLESDSWKLAGWNLCYGGLSRAPGLGLHSEFALQNLLGSGIVCVIERVDITPRDNTTQIILGQNQIGATAVGADSGITRVRDFRPTTDQIPQSVIRGDDALTFTQVLSFQALGGTTFTLEPPKGVAVLPPGSTLVLRLNLIDEVGFCAFWWRERPIDPSENNF